MGEQSRRDMSVGSHESLHLAQELFILHLFQPPKIFVPHPLCISHDRFDCTNYVQPEEQFIFTLMGYYAPSSTSTKEVEQELRCQAPLIRALVSAAQSLSATSRVKRRAYRFGVATP
jgi:hypothetical protein